jgi:hypothetical protein
MAVLRYQSRLDIVYHGDHAGLRRYLHTDVYERDDAGDWRIVWSQATRAAVENVEENVEEIA